MPQSEKMTEYEKQRLKRIEENKARMKAMGLDKMASAFTSSIPVSQNNNNKKKKKGKKKVGLDDDDDEEYNPSAAEEESKSSSSGSDDEYCASRMKKSKPKKSTPSKKISKLSSTSNAVDDEDEALLKAIALSLQDSQGFLDVKNKTPPQISEANVENPERKQSARKDDSGKRKRKNLFKSRVQMTEDELILHFFQFDEAGKGGISLRDVQRVAASHDFTWKDEEMEHMIHFFDGDGDGKLSLEDFTKIVERCNMRRESENAEQVSMTS
ncbi:uncharacterized protein LOC143621742 [Bidens hawaiensis]|uniref:uncharacterized protein LOC143621742 n=1 Tax=Bidens hawaiensis TaxID=980011 RepID=UPI00404A44CB